MLLIPSRSAIKQCFLDTPHQCSLWFPQFDQQRRGIWPPTEKREKCTNLNTVKFSSTWKQAHHTTIILGSVWSRNFHPSAQFVLWDGLWVKGGAERKIVNLQEGASCGVVVMAWSKRDMDERPRQGSCEWKFETVSGQRNQRVDGWQREYNQRLCENWCEPVRDNIHLQAIQKTEMFGNNKWYGFAFLAKIPICYHTFVLITIGILHCVWNCNWSKFLCC